MDVVGAGFEVSGALLVHSDRQRSRLQTSRDQSQHQVVWDEMPADIGSHHGLLQQLAHSGYYFGEENIVFGRSNHKSSAGDLILGSEGVDVLLQRHAGHLAHQVFEVMPQMDVVWDDDLLHDVESQDGLLQQVAGFGKSLVDDEKMASVKLDISDKLRNVSDDKPLLDLDMMDNGEAHVVENNFLMVKAPMDEPSLDTGIPMLLELDMAPVDVVPCLDVVWDDESIMSNMLMQNTTSFPMLAGIVDTDELQQDVSHDNLLKLVAPEECLVGMDSETIAELVTFKVRMATKDNAGELFDETHCIDAIWDEEPQHGFDSCGLLQEHAEGIDAQMQGKHEDLTPPIVMYDSLWWQLAFGKAYLGDEKNNLVVRVGDDKVFTHAGDSSRYPEVGLVAANHGLNKLLKHSMVDSDNLSNAMLFKANSSLQLEEVGVGFAKRLPAAESVAVNFSPQCLNQDSKNTFFFVLCEEWAGQVLACNMVELNASEVLTHVGDKRHANLGLDGDCTSGFDTCDNLLQQLAWGRVVFAYEMGKPITKPVLGDVFMYAGNLTVTIDSDMHLSDQICKSQLSVAAYLIEVKHREAIISRSRWDSGIWSYLFMGLTLRMGEIPVLTMFIQKFSEVFSLPILCIIILTRHLVHLLLTKCMDFSDISNFANQVMVQAAINPGLSDKRLVMHGHLLEKSVWELNIEQGQNGTNFSNQELNYDSDNLVTWEQMQGYHELTPWKLSASSPRHYNTEIAWSWFSPWSKRTRAHKQQQLELYRMPERQWDLYMLGLVLIYSESVLLIASFRRYATDVELDEHRIDFSSWQKALGLQIQYHFSTNGNERTVVLKEIRLSLVAYVISWCIVLKYRTFKCQNLCSLYKFKQDETSHGEDGLQASVLDQFLTWTVWTCRSQSDANCVADLVLEDMIFGVLIGGNLSAGKRCFSLLSNYTVCIPIILPIIRPWDPGGVEEFAHKF